MPSLRRKLLSGTAYTLLSVVAVQAISLVTSVIYARFLGTVNLGMLAVFQQLSGAIVPLSNLGLATAITRMIPEYRKRGAKDVEVLLSSALFVVLVSGAIVSLSYFVLSDYLADLYQVPEFVLLIQISASIVVLDALLQLAAAFVQGFQKVKELALLGIAARLATVPVIFHLTLEFQLLGAVVASVVGLLLNIAIYFRAIRGILRSERLKVAWVRFDRKAARNVLRIALPLFASFIVLRPALLFQSSFLALTLGYDDVGLYRIGTSLYRIGLLLPAALSVPLLPAISEMYAEHTRERTRGQLSSLIRITVFLSLPITLALGLAARPVIEFLYGPAYSGAATLVFIISAAAFVDTVGLIVEQTLLGTGRTVQVFLLALMQALTLSVGSFILIPAFGLLGIGYATLLNGILYATVVGVYLLARRELSFREIRVSLGLSLAAFAVAAAIVLQIGLGSLLVAAGFLAVLLVVEFLLLSKEDRSVLIDAMKGIFEGSGS